MSARVTRSRRRSHDIAGTRAALVVALFAVPAIYLGVATLMPQPAATAAANALMTIVPAASAVMCWRAGARTGARFWYALAGLCGFWAAGQCVWTYYEVWGGREVPFPSAADVGYLGAVPFGVAAALLLPHSTGLSRVRFVLDGLMVAASLLFVAWVFILSHIVTAGAAVVEMVVSSAYPVTDIAIVTAVAAALPNLAIAYRKVAALVLAGLAAIAMADIAFTYLVTLDAYGTGNVIDVGWVVGFLLIGMAATGRIPVEHDEAWHAHRSRRRITAVLAPYLLLTPMITTLGWLLVTARPVTAPMMWIGFVAFFLLAVRHGLATLDSEVRADALEYRARHDDLTGLTNRRAFGRFLNDAIARDKQLAVLLIDVDDFKRVNDVFGHAAGDELLVAVAAAIQGALREKDLAARLGGDEFAATLRDITADEAVDVAQRIIDNVAAGLAVEGSQHPTTISVGIAITASRGDDADALLRNADLAMYAAKRLGKGRWQLFGQFPAAASAS